MLRPARIIFAAFLLLMPPAAPLAQADETDFFDLSLEELVDLQITSVSRKREEASKAASAVFVLTAEDIRRSGVTSIPEALRLVPGLQVARLDSKRWAISARGFNNVFAMKLLVMVDGRTVYKTLFSGTEWDEIHVLLDDIERIEVIRGPGASLWGANAVNGVINIITKSSRDTKGTYAYIGGGNEERAMAGFRQGGNLGEEASWRVSGGYFNRDRFERNEGGSPYDQWWGPHGAFRLDSEPNERDLLTLQGDAYYVSEEQGYEPDPIVAIFDDIHSERGMDTGGSVLGRWTRTLDNSSELQLQMYYAHVARDDKIFNEQIDTFDFDFQHRFSPLPGNDVLWGAGYRHNIDSTVGTFELGFEPSDMAMDLFTGFFQDEITLVPDRLRLIAGTKLEHNEFTGLELQPTARLAWTPNESHTVWSAVSRAVRTPSRMEHGTRMYYGGATDTFLGAPLIARGFGNPDIEAENVYAYELGYRTQITKTLSLDIAGFYNEYHDQLSMELGELERFSEPVDYVLAPLTAANKMAFRSRGAEVVLNYQPVESWRLVGSYSHIRIEFDQSSTSNIDFLRIFTDEAPEHQFSLRSLFNISENVELDGTLRYMGRIKVGRYDDVLRGEPVNIPEYVELDLRAAWKPSKHWEMAVVGQNLLNGEHPEWAEGLFGQLFGLNERGVYGKITYRH